MGQGYDTDLAFQWVAYGLRSDGKMDGYLRGKDASHRSDNEGVMKP